MNETTNKIIEILLEAGNIAKYYFQNEDNLVQTKLDKSHVSSADKEINNFICKQINEIDDKFEILSEEDTAENQLKSISGETFFIIDPIDGTSSYIQGSKQFTINISYINNHKLCFSAICIPFENEIYFADNNDTYLHKNYAGENNVKISRLKKVNYKEKKIINVITTKRKDEIDKIKFFLKKSKKNLNFNSMSSAKKFCSLAIGENDIYIRKAKIKIWDIIAGFHITNNLGFIIEDFHGNNIYENISKKEYLKKISYDSFRINEFIIRPARLEIP